MSECMWTPARSATVDAPAELGRRCDPGVHAVTGSLIRPFCAGFDLFRKRMLLNG